MLTRRSVLAMPLAAAQMRRPNIVFVMVDDLRWDELRCNGHPFAESPNADRLAQEGANFVNAFATTPLCSPSRACFLTGTYSHTNGITDNVDRSPRSHQLVTWPRLLHDSGYDSAFIGKWHMGNDSSPRPGFDHWVSFPGQGESIDPVLNIDGKTVHSKGYVTDVLTQHSVNFIERKRSQPFCVYLAQKAIHPNIKQNNDGSVSSHGTASDFIVADRHKNLYSGKTPSRRGNYLKPPKSKPALEQKIPGLPTLGRETATDDATILNRMRMTKAIDEGLGGIYESLAKAGVLDDTILIYTSDHGYFYGEHCLSGERRLAYEETIRIPLIVRYPRAFPVGSRQDRLVLSLDVGATALDLAGVHPPQPFHGRPLMGTQKRDSVLIEYFSDKVFARIRNMAYQAVRTDRWKYIHYLELPGADELYDLRADPFELNNLIRDPKAPLAQMKTRLNQLLRETGA